MFAMVSSPFDRVDKKLSTALALNIGVAVPISTPRKSEFPEAPGHAVSP
jgi:hypothetical protein